MFSGITKISLTAPNIGSSFSAIDTTSIPNAVNSVYTGNPLIFILILGIEVLYLFSIITAIVGVGVSNPAISWVCVGLNGLAVLATAATFALSFIIYVRAITPAVATLAETLYNLAVQANLTNTAANTDTTTMLPTSTGISIILLGVAMGLALFAFGAFIRSALIGGHRGSKASARLSADLPIYSRPNNAASNRRPTVPAVISEPNMESMPLKSSTYRNQQQSISGSSPATPKYQPSSIKDPSYYRPGGTAANTSSVPSSNYYYYPQTQQQNTSTAQYYYYPTVNANATSANYTVPYNSTTAAPQNTSGGTTTAYGSYGNDYQMYGYYVQPAAAAQDDRRNTYATAGAGSTDEGGSGRVGSGTGTLERRGQARNNQFNYSVYEPARYTG
ncbi:hypothetical protein BJ742DRAFT_836796 [Cladochytrium replicatum]|nr:hypothetical protein BJ742DRAFT_836796 [Cladochytrium replicatum]